MRAWLQHAFTHAGGQESTASEVEAAEDVTPNQEQYIEHVLKRTSQSSHDQLLVLGKSAAASQGI